MSFYSDYMSIGDQPFFRPQMYKKRFAKWGFHKNTKSQPKGSTSPGRPTQLASTPKMSHGDALSLMLSTSVQTWAASFFEHNTSVIPTRQQPQWPPTAQAWWTAKAGETGFTFRLVIDLLNRGHGALAGRMARKAFILLEDVLTLEGPALVWNLLDIMHNMLALGQTQLFAMLVRHLVALADGQMMGKTHPLVVILDSLGQLSSGASLYSGLLFLLEKAWILNAGILFEKFNPRLIMMYSRMDWESCSIAPPLALFGTTDTWIPQIKAEPIVSNTQLDMNNTGGEEIDVGQNNLLQTLLSARTDTSPPQNYEILRSTNMTAIQERSESLLHPINKTMTFTGNTASLLGMLAGLVTDQVLEGAGVTKTTMTTAPVPRIHAGNVACVIRTLLDLSEAEGKNSPADVIERTRAIIALREYAHGETDPQVVRELFSLVDALVAAGECEEAERVEGEVRRRVERYIEEIPAGLVPV